MSVKVNKNKNKKHVDLSYDELIESIENRLEVLKSCKEYVDYFKPISKSRQTYIVEVRKQVADYMIGMGANYSDVAKVLCRTPSSILHLVKIKNKERVVKEVAEGYKEWIKNKKYPRTLNILVPNEINHNGTGSDVDYVLVDMLYV